MRVTLLVLQADSCLELFTPRMLLVEQLCMYTTNCMSNWLLSLHCSRIFGTPWSECLPENACPGPAQRRAVTPDTWQFVLGCIDWTGCLLPSRHETCSLQTWLAANHSLEDTQAEMARLQALTDAVLNIAEPKVTFRLIQVHSWVS